jgi:hypothetical protein
MRLHRAARCGLSLSLNLSMNLRAREPSRAVDALGPLNENLLRRLIPPKDYQWIMAGVRFVSLTTDGRLTLSAPRKVIKTELAKRYGPQILECAPGADRLDVVVQAEPSTVKAAR